MILIESYIKIEEAFVPVSKFKDEIPDTFYVEGAIELTINGVEFLTKNHWDLIDQFWSYIVNVLEELEHQNECSTYFPDQPIKLALELNKTLRQINIELNVPESRFVIHPPEIRKITVALDEFLAAVNEAGQKFFLRMAEIVPEEQDDYKREAQRLREAVGRILNQ